MTDTPAKPILFLKPGCPFCLKVRLFLLEAGLLDRVEVREFAPGSDEEASIRRELSPHFDTVSFPTAKFDATTYVGESDAIVARFADAADLDPASLPTYRSYTDGVYRLVQTLWQENVALKKRPS